MVRAEVSEADELHAELEEARAVVDVDAPTRTRCSPDSCVRPMEGMPVPSHR